MKTPSTTLLHVLIGKSILETLLVGALALFGFMTVLPPYFHGWGEFTSERISGWAVNDAAPWERVEVQLFIDGKFVAAAIANEPRPDVLASGWSKDPWHGYTFSLMSIGPGSHYGRVYALHESGNGRRKSLQLLGDPIHFVVGDPGRTMAPIRETF